MAKRKKKKGSTAGTVVKTAAVFAVGGVVGGYSWHLWRKHVSPLLDRRKATRNDDELDVDDDDPVENGARSQPAMPSYGGGYGFQPAMPMPMMPVLPMPQFVPPPFTPAVLPGITQMSGYPPQLPAPAPAPAHEPEPELRGRAGRRSASEQRALERAAQLEREHENNRKKLDKLAADFDRYYDELNG